jgi:cytochrome b subunit of formate dehydrogenase
MNLSGEARQRQQLDEGARNRMNNTENNKAKNKGYNSRLKKLARYSAWLLLAAVIVLVVSGWGITQTGVIYRFTFGLVDRGLANTIHRATNVPLAVFFLAHVLINIKINISQKHPSRAWLTNSILGVIGIGAVAIMIYLEYFRSGG